MHQSWMCLWPAYNIIITWDNRHRSCFQSFQFKNSFPFAVSSDVMCLSLVNTLTDFNAIFGIGQLWCIWRSTCAGVSDHHLVRVVFPFVCGGNVHLLATLQKHINGFRWNFQQRPDMVTQKFAEIPHHKLYREFSFLRSLMTVSRLAILFHVPKIRDRRKYVLSECFLLWMCHVVFHVDRKPSIRFARLLYI